LENGFYGLNGSKRIIAASGRHFIVYKRYNGFMIHAEKDPCKSVKSVIPCCRARRCGKKYSSRKLLGEDA
jgi:hypothetical protein